MPSTTARGVPYPAPGDPDNVPSDMANLAGWVNDRPGVAAISSAQRNALSGAELWVGRCIYNTTTAQVEIYGGSAWTPGGSYAQGLTGSAISALSGAQLYPGRLAFNSDTKAVWRYDGTSWGPVVDPLVYVATSIAAPAITATGTATYTVPLGATLRSARVALGSGTFDSGGQPGALLDVNQTSGQAIGMAFSPNGSIGTTASLAVGGSSASLGTLRASNSNGTNEIITDCYLSAGSLIVAVSRTWATGYTVGASSIAVVAQGRL